MTLCYTICVTILGNTSIYYYASFFLMFTMSNKSRLGMIKKNLEFYSLIVLDISKRNERHVTFLWKLTYWL